MEKNKGLSILKIFIVIICILSIIAVSVTNFAFSNGKEAPSVFGKWYFYVVDKQDNMSKTTNNTIVEGHAVICKSVKKITIENDNIVLCYPADDHENLRVRKIINADPINDKYGTCDDSHIDKGGADGSGTIKKSDIVAICDTESKDLGAFITFATSVKGLILMLVLPCVILVILLIAKFAGSDMDMEDDENFDFYEYDENEKKADNKPNHVKSDVPLFEAAQDIQPSEELERKKMSIAENFSQKKVSQDSPYQKEKERTMQFKAQRSAESAFAARNVGGSSSTAPTADALREEMLRKTAEAERTGTFNLKATSVDPNAQTVSDNTGILSKAQLAEMSRNDIPRTTPLRSQSAANTTAPKKSSSPDITDILRKTDTKVSKKKPVSDLSVDDLLRIIENEKKKL